MFEESSSSIRGIDLSALEPTDLKDLLDYMRVHQENMERFVKVGYRNFLKEKLESEVSQGKLFKE